MKRKTLLVVLMATLALLLSHPMFVYSESPPQTACFFFGTVQDLEGYPVSTGTVKAYTDDFGLGGEEEIVDGQFYGLAVSYNGITVNSGTPVYFRVVINGTEMDATSVPESVPFYSGQFYDGVNYPLINLTVNHRISETATYFGTVTDQFKSPIQVGTVKAYINEQLHGQADLQNGQYSGLAISGDSTELQGKAVNFKVVIDEKENDAISEPEAVTWSEGVANVNMVVNIAVTPREKGDVNGDGVIGSSTDINMAIDFALGISNPTNEEFAAADVNDDGKISLLDVVSIIKTS